MLRYIQESYSDHVRNGRLPLMAEKRDSVTLPKTLLRPTYGTIRSWKMKKSPHRFFLLLRIRVTLIKRSTRRIAMNLPHAATPAPLSHERHREPDTRLSGRWLLIVRVAWIILVMLTLASFIILLPSYYAQLQSVCTNPTCALVQPTPASVHAMQQLGLSVSSYATF